MRNICFITSIVFLINQPFFAQVTIATQGGEAGDTWGFTSSGADNAAISESFASSNLVSGAQSIVVGGNSGGGSCFDGGSGNGTSTVNSFVFNAIDISGSSNYNRTLTFNWGNRFPVCIGTGWDSGENLVFTAFHNGVAQPSSTLATGSNNANFNIDNNQFSWSIPSCVTEFYFTLSITTNRRDELLFVDNVVLSTPNSNQPIPNTSLISGDIEICIGNSQVVSVLPVVNTFYSWSGLPSTAQFTTPNNTLNSNQISIDWGTTPAGIYTIFITPSMNVCGVLTDGNPAAIDITLTEAPNIVVQGSATICAGESAIISASGANNYMWDNGLGAGDQFTVAPIVSTTYQVTGSIGNCQGTNSITITVTNSLVVGLTASSTSICLGETVTLTANGGNNYSWINANGLNGNSGTIVTATPTISTTYNVTGMIGNCQANGSIFISVNPLPIINAGNDVNVCEGSFVSLSASGAATLNWNQNVQNGISFQPQFTQIYTVEGINTFGCVGTDEVMVTVNPKPNVEFQASVLSGCSPFQTQFSSNLDNIQNYSWNFGDGNTSQESTPMHTYVNEGCNDVELTVTSLNGCSASLTMMDYICADVKPIANFEVNPNSLSDQNLVAYFLNLSENAVNYTWTFGDSTFSTEVSPEHQYSVNESGAYWVTLFAYSAQGCFDSITQKLPIIENVIYYVPNVFTPDGNEFNQTFQPVFSAGFDPTAFEMLIFNRWGEIVFESRDASIGWDGTNGIGKIVSDGIYSWKIAFSAVNNDNRKVIFGHVNLIR